MYLWTKSIPTSTMPSTGSQQTRRKLLSGLGTGAALALAGCSQGSNGSGNTTTESGPTEITYRDRFDSLKQYATAFNKSHDAVHVNPSMKPPQSKYQGLISEITAGNAPEVVGLDVVQLPRFAELGALSNMESFYKELDYTDDFFEPVQRDFISYEGTRYALPYWIDLSVYYYNKRHFEEAGLDPENPPTTWEEYRNAAAKLTTEDRTGLAATYKTAGQELFTFMPFVWANGGSLFNEDKTEAMVDKKPAVEALQLLTDLTENGYIESPVSQGWNEVHNAFANGNASMMHSGGYGIGYIRQNKPEMLKDIGTAVFPKPKGGQHSSFIGGNSIVIPKQTQKNEQKYKAAKEFVKWVNTEEGMKTTLDLGFFPARKSGFELPTAKKNERLFSAFQTALSEGHAPPMHTNILQLSTELRSAIQNALMGEKSPENALSDAAKAMNKILQK